MAYRDLVAGDDVKVRDFGNEWHGYFGKVVDTSTNYVYVDLGFSHNVAFSPEKLMVAVISEFTDYIYNDDEEEETDDQIVMRSLLERVSKLEKEILDMKSHRQYN